MSIDHSPQIDMFDYNFVPPSTSFGKMNTENKEEINDAANNDLLDFCEFITGESKKYDDLLEEMKKISDITINEEKDEKSSSVLRKRTCIILPPENIDTQD